MSEYNGMYISEPLPAYLGLTGWAKRKADSVSALR